MFHILGLIFAHHTATTLDTPVRATLGDGQILMGEVQTKTLRLQGGEGLLEIPLSDVGEVVPASAGGLGEAQGKVDVWLRNGSELHGTWADPRLAMSIAVGGAAVPIDLPMNDLSRFQLQGGTRWPGGPVYRMRTRFGDDFLVDPARTHLVLKNDLGTFSPLLSECQAVAPVGDPEGPWRIQLQTGTVLLGKLVDDTVTVALPMGPAEVSVPLAQFVSLRVESWGPTPQLAAPPRMDDEDRSSQGAVGESYAPSAGVSYDQPAEAPQPDAVESKRGRSGPSRAKPSIAPPSAAPAAAGEWFDNGALQATKAAQGNGQ